MKTALPWSLVPVTVSILILTGCSTPAAHASAQAAPVVAPDWHGGPPPALGRDPRLVDKSCKTDADCAAKNVGSCCGAFPECVNAAAVTHPDEVKAFCGRQHMMGMCMIPVIQGCHCIAGQCAADPHAPARH